jgi:hypothetical protein
MIKEAFGPGKLPENDRKPVLACGKIVTSRFLAVDPAFLASAE